MRRQVVGARGKFIGAVGEVGGVAVEEGECGGPVIHLLDGDIPRLRRPAPFKIFLFSL